MTLIISLLLVLQIDDMGAIRVGSTPLFTAFAAGSSTLRTAVHFLKAGVFLRETAFFTYLHEMVGP